MSYRMLRVEGALAFEPVHLDDHRGRFVTTYDEPSFVAAVGRPLFRVAQASHNRSRAGVLRGLHYTIGSPPTALYVTCVRGRARDLVVDLRVGSPTFGSWDQVELDTEHWQAVYVPPGVGHGFVALEDDTTISYLLSESYDASAQRSISARDPALGLPIPDGCEPLMSARDRDAPTLHEAAAAGLLPGYRSEGMTTP